MYGSRNARAPYSRPWVARTQTKPQPYVTVTLAPPHAFIRNRSSAVHATRNRSPQVGHTYAECQAQCSRRYRFGMASIPQRCVSSTPQLLLLLPMETNPRCGLCARSTMVRFRVWQVLQLARPEHGGGADGRRSPASRERDRDYDSTTCTRATEVVDRRGAEHRSAFAKPQRVHSVHAHS